ncbi:unnamed protein product [Calicophoron daubneyi]
MTVQSYYAILAATTYMVCSIGIMFTNKLVLTSYQFPSFLTLGLVQTLFTFLLIRIFFSSELNKTDRPDVFRKVFPLSVCYATDIVMGIAGTGSINLPMFSALRRLSNMFIMIGEYIFLGIVRTCAIYTCVVVMVLGAGVAAVGDITFDALGYTYIFINNFSTAGKALLTKSRLRDQGFSSLELLYYNSGFMVPFLAVLVFVRTDFNALIQFREWTNPLFLLYFIFSCCSAVLLNYSLLQCTHYTSALTTSVIGVIKNIVVTYAGMFVGGDYRYTHTNFIGFTLGVLGAILYIYYAYKQNQSEGQKPRGAADYEKLTELKITHQETENKG